MSSIHIEEDCSICEIKILKTALGQEGAKQYILSDDARGSVAGT